MCGFSCLRQYVETSSVLTLLASGAALGFIISQMVQDGEFFSNGSFQFQNYSIWMLFGASFLLLIGSIFGVYGSCKKGRHIISLFIYNIFNIALTLVFLGFGFFYVFKFKSVIGDLKGSSDCLNLPEDLTFITQANTAATTAGSIFCNELCQCYIKSDIAIQLNNSTLSNVNSFNSSLPTNVQGCPNFNSYNIATETTELMSLIETTFQCSGICTGFSHYIFSNINNGVPKSLNGCKQEIVDFMSNFGDYLMAISFVVGFFLFINVFAVFALFCHQDNKNKDVYALMKNEI